MYIYIYIYLIIEQHTAAAAAVESAVSRLARTAAPRPSQLWRTAGRAGQGAAAATTAAAPVCRYNFKK